MKVSCLHFLTFFLFFRKISALAHIARHTLAQDQSLAFFFEFAFVGTFFTARKVNRYKHKNKSENDVVGSFFFIEARSYASLPAVDLDVS